MNVLAIIPARSGSKSVKDKNIRKMNGVPLMSYSIGHALASSYINRVIVSTDSPKYADIALSCGAEVPFLRPAAISGDSSLDIEVFRHALDTLYQRELYIADIVVHLRPTYPIRNVQDIDSMIELLIENSEADSVRCITPAKEIPYKMWRKEADGRIFPLLTDIPEAYNMPRQSLPTIYYQNACIDVIRASVITQQHSMTGKTVLGYEMTNNFDIDTEEEFLQAEAYLKIHDTGKTYVFDIDGIIASFQDDLNYANAVPIESTIRLINKLYSQDNKIILFTARGYKSGINWEELTRNQLNAWGVQYHKLLFGKPDADYYIDDKLINIELLHKALEEN